MEELEEKEIEFLEKFIKENKPTFEPCISIRDTERKKVCYNLIKNSPIGSYCIYGGSGFRTYSFYKGKDNNIYNFEIYLQDPIEYSIQN